MGRAERRLVTCVFVDVVESTDLTVRLGPERMKRVLGDAFAELSALALENGGTIEKYVGDEIFVLFGAPLAHPDDPERALRFGDAAVRWSRDRRDVPLAVRVGMETGDALVDLEAIGAERQQMAVGTCVNLAARLRGDAEPGEVLVGPACAAATGDVAELEDLGPRRLKGLGEVRVHRLARFRGGRPASTPPFVGRAAELERLRSALARARVGRARFALVSGSPGLGKSRLVEEFVASTRGGARVLTARCRPGTEQGANTPLRQLLTEDIGEPSAEALDARLMRLVGETSDRARVAEGIAHGAGVRIVPRLAALRPVERIEELAFGWRHYLNGLARERPLIVWFEDLHWADANLVRLVERLWPGLDAPVLIVATARPELGGASLRPHPDLVVLELEPLGRDAARSLAASVGGDERAATRAEGNPLFILELARARTSSEDLPVTVQGAIGARLDELPPADRELLQRSAVAGETFGVRDAALLSDRDAADVAGVLGRLAHLRYIRAVNGSFRFEHALVRDVAYSRLPAEDRLRFHARFASDGVHPEDVEALAHHWWEALGSEEAAWVWEGEARLEEMRRAALQAHVAAGKRLVDRVAYDAGLAILERARGFAREPREIGDVETALAVAYLRNSDGDKAWDHYMRAMAAYRDAQGESPPDLYPQMLFLPTSAWGYFRRLPEEAHVRALLDEGVASARRANDRVSLATLLAQRGAFAARIEDLDEARAIVDAAPDLRPYAVTLQRLGQVLAFAGEARAASATFDRLMTLGALPATLVEADVFALRALAAYEKGDLARAREYGERALGLAVSRSAHTKQHALAARALSAFGAGEWDELRSIAGRLRELVAASPGAGFCIIGAYAAGSAAAADVVTGSRPPADLDAFLERLVPESATVRASSRLLSRAVSGIREIEPDAVAAQEAAARVWDRQLWDPIGAGLVIAHVVLERWYALDGLLERLDRYAANGGGLAGALVEAAREEAAAARGGPKPRHEALRALGYRGLSELFSYRPR